MRFDPRTFQQVAIRYTDYAIPTHLIIIIILIKKKNKKEKPTTDKDGTACGQKYYAKGNRNKRTYKLLCKDIQRKRNLKFVIISVITGAE
jgi:hypothetical protein